jgi:hypothetical protein
MYVGMYVVSNGAMLTFDFGERFGIFNVSSLALLPIYAPAANPSNTLEDFFNATYSPGKKELQKWLIH